PSLPETKLGEDFFAIWGGIIGCQALLAVVLDAGHHERGLALERVAALTASAPAARFRLPAKGRIEPGADADLALADLAGETALTPETLRHRHPHSPWAGRTLRGRIARTLVRGTTVSVDGRIVAAAGGRLVTPTPTEES